MLPGLFDARSRSFLLHTTLEGYAGPALRSTRALRTLAWGAVAVGIATPLVRHRLRLRPPVVSALSWPAPAALALAAPRTPVRDAAIYALQMWAYFAHFDMPDDDPDALLRRLKVDYTVRCDRVIGLGTAPTLRLQRRSAARARSARSSTPCQSCTGAGSSSRTGRSAYMLVRHREQFPRSAMMMAACFDLGCVVYWLVPDRRHRGTPEPTGRCRRCGGSWRRPGERFWKRLWHPLYHSLQGNPFAAMPSLHFGTSVMAARILSQVGRGHAAAGWAYALTLGFGLVYLGEHYVIDLIAGLALAEGDLAGGTARGARDPDDRGGRASTGAAGRVMAAERPPPPVLDHRNAELDRRLDEEVKLDLERRRSSRSAASQALLQDRRKIVSGLVLVLRARSSRSTCCSRRSWAPTRRSTTSTTPSGTGSWSRSASTCSRSWPTWRCSAACSAARATTTCTAASTCAPRTRSRWPASPPPGSSRPRARADRAHLLGASQGRACRAGAQPAGWSPSSSSPTSSTWRRWSYSACCCAPACCTAGPAGRARSSPPPSPAGSSLLFLMIALIPQDFERRIQHYARGYRRARYLQRIAEGPATLAMGVRTAIAYLRHPRPRPAGGRRSGGLLGGQHRHPLGELRGVRRPRALRGARPGLLPGHGRQPDPVAGRRRRRGGRRHDRRLRDLRHRRLDRLPGGAHLPRDRVLAADPAGNRRLHPAEAAPWPSGSASAAKSPCRRLHFRK